MDSNRIAIGFIAEDTYGVKKTGSQLQALRLTNESLKQNQDVVTSSELRSDRQRGGVKRVSLAVDGNIEGELSYATYDDFMKAALMTDADWTAEVEDIGPEVTISAAASGNTFADSGNGLAGYDVGEWIRVSGFTTAANNGIFKLLTVAAGAITVSGGTLVDRKSVV